MGLTTRTADAVEWRRPESRTQAVLAAENKAGDVVQALWRRLEDHD